MRNQYSADYRIENKAELYEFQSVSERTIEIQDKIITLSCEARSSSTLEENHVRNKYRHSVDIWAERSARLIRMTLCILSAGFAFAFFVVANWDISGTPLFKPLIPATVLGSVVSVIIAIKSFTSDWPESLCEKIGWSIIAKQPAFKADIQKAKEQDEENNQIRSKERQKELDALKQQQKNNWLYNEWLSIVGDIRSQAERRGISRYMDQSNSEIAKIVISKLFHISFCNNMTCRTVMQEAKEKAIKDWKECADSSDRIADMLAGMFRSL